MRGLWMHSSGTNAFISMRVMVDMMPKNSRKFLGKSTGMARVVELINWKDTNRI